MAALDTALRKMMERFLSHLFTLYKITKQIPPEMNMSEIGGNIAKRRWNVEGNVHLQEMGKRV